jgi:ribosomal protein S27AE
MPFSQSKIITMNKLTLHGARNYPGEKPGQILADWFNRKHKPLALCGVSVRLVILDRKGGRILHKWLRNPGAWLGQYFPQFRKQIKSGDWSLGSPYLSALIQFLGQGLHSDRIPECSRCGKRFYARFKHQRFCGQRCQELHWKSSPRGKKYHREKSRQYRELKKTHPNVG